MKVFISYAHDATDIAEKIANLLKESGFEVWSENEILPGDNWAEKVAQALRDSNAMVVLLTPAALKSSWVLHETQYALSEERYNLRLIPVIIGDSKELEAKIPWIFKKLQLITVVDPWRDDSGLQQIVQALSQEADDFTKETYNYAAQ